MANGLTCLLPPMPFSLLQKEAAEDKTPAAALLATAERLHVEDPTERSASSTSTGADDANANAGDEVGIVRRVLATVAAPAVWMLVSVPDWFSDAVFQVRSQDLRDSHGLLHRSVRVKRLLLGLYNVLPYVQFVVRLLPPAPPPSLLLRPI